MKKQKIKQPTELRLSFEECLNRMQFKMEEVAERVHQTIMRLYRFKRQEERDEWKDWNISEQLE